MTTDNIKQQLQTIMTTTPEEDKQYLNEVTEEIKTKRKPGRPRIYTIEEAKERVRQYDLRRYRENREKKQKWLKGSEIKSIRAGKVNIAESYAIEKDGEIILINSHIPTYKEASYSNHNPTDERKLLFNKKEINKLIGKINREGFTLIPTKMYFKKGKAKIEVAVAKGKKQFDKRQTKKTRDWNRDRSRYVRKTS